MKIETKWKETVFQKLRDAIEEPRGLHLSRADVQQLHSTHDAEKTIRAAAADDDERREYFVRMTQDKFEKILKEHKLTEVVEFFEWHELHYVRKTADRTQSPDIWLGRYKEWERDQVAKTRLEEADHSAPKVVDLIIGGKIAEDLYVEAINYEIDQWRNSLVHGYTAPLHEWLGFTMDEWREYCKNPEGVKTILRDMRGEINA